MSTGGYQGPSADFSPSGFGSDSPEMGSRNGSITNMANAPLFGVDYKRCAGTGRKRKSGSVYLAVVFQSL